MNRHTREHRSDQASRIKTVPNRLSLRARASRRGSPWVINHAGRSMDRHVASLLAETRFAILYRNLLRSRYSGERP